MTEQQTYREFLLGISDPETERQIEEGILDGSIDPAFLRLAEDDLIDDYLFGWLSPEEQERFNSGLAFSPGRKQELAFAQALRRYANTDAASGVGASSLQLVRSPKKDSGWKAVAIIAIAACLIGAIAVGVENSRLQYGAQQARNAQDEINRLHSALVQEQVRRDQPATDQTPQPSEGAQAGSSSHGPGPVAALTLQPELTRGLERQMVLRAGAHSQVVWLQLEFPSALKGAFRQEMLTDAGERIWMEEFTAPAAAPITSNTIALPAALLVPGDYRIRLEEIDPGGSAQVIATYSFRFSRR